MIWGTIRKEFEETDITMKNLAEKHGVNDSTLRSRKTREKWQRRNKKSNATKKATQRSKVATDKAIKELNDNSFLNDKQKHFCLLYLKYFNATKSYKEAYGCTYDAARTSGSQLLANPNIKAELSRLKEAQNKALYLDSLDIKKEWIKQAFADINDFVEYGYKVETYIDENGMPVFDEDGNAMTYERSFLNFKDMNEVDGSVIQEIRTGKDGPVIKLYDKQKALAELMKHIEGAGDTTPIVIVDRWQDDE